MRILGERPPMPSGGMTRDDAGPIGGVNSGARLPALTTTGVVTATTQIETWMPVDPAAMATVQAAAATFLYGPGEIPAPWQPSTAYKYGQSVIMLGAAPDVDTGITYYSIYICNQVGYTSGTDWPTERDYLSPLDPTVTDPTTGVVSPDPSYLGASLHSLWLYGGYAGPAAGALGGPPGTSNFGGYSSTPATSDELAAQAAGFTLDDVTVLPFVIAAGSTAPYIINAYVKAGGWYQYAPTITGESFSGGTLHDVGKRAPGWSELTSGLFQVWGIPRVTNIQYFP